MRCLFPLVPRQLLFVFLVWMPPVIEEDNILPSVGDSGAGFFVQ
ncbi:MULTISPECIES: hypothetical protein [Candidatus Ichthyocystis]|nr:MULTISPECIES: hypothetical protein [Ichthyocystis]